MKIFFEYYKKNTGKDVYKYAICHIKYDKKEFETEKFEVDAT